MPRALVVVLLLASCRAEPGELDRDVVLALSRTRGGAEGIERTGRHAVTLFAESCGCPRAALQPFDWASLCGPALLLEGEAASEIDVVETDGLLLVRIPGVGSLTGPIDPDDGFSVGAVIDLGSPVSHGSIVLRADGFFRPTNAPVPAPYSPWAIETTLRRRLVGEIAEEPMDCTEIVWVEDTRDD
jgi:hypothetical protein